jgi:neutral ceramidase
MQEGEAPRALRLRVVGVLIAALGVGLGSGEDAQAAGLRAGAAVADITPPVGTPMFAYTARSGVANPSRAFQIVADPDENLYAKSFEPSDGIHSGVRAAAIVIERGDERFALVSTDLGGLPYALVQEVVARIAPTGIDAEHLLLSATHTHSSTGPIWPADSSGYAALGGDIFDPRIFELTAAGIAESVVEAAGRLEPARVGVGSTRLRGASRNRNFEPFRLNSDVPEDETEARRASIDPRLTVVRVDSTSGDPLGVWSSFAVHQTSFGDDNLLFSGDNAATTERFVEERLAGETPGGPDPVSVWVNGAEGDVSPDGDPAKPDGDPLHYVPNAFAAANLTGIRVARGVLRAWRVAGERMRRPVALAARRTFVAFDGSESGDEPVGPVAVLGAGGIVAPDGFCAPSDGFAGPGQGRKFPALEGAGLVPSTAAVSLLRVGPLLVAAFPAEITTQMGRRITAAVEDAAGAETEAAVIAGLTNGYISYTATPEEYDACHYEGSFTLFGRQQGGRYLETAVGLVDSLYGGGPPPAGAAEPPPTGFGGADQAPLEATPDAGSVVAEPANRVRRYRAVQFSWLGGDPAIDAPRGRTFVRLQQRRGGEWRTVGTEDGVADITVWDRGAGTWTETWQLGRCDPVGRYRFRVQGLAVRSSDAEPEPYSVASRPFRVASAPPLEPIDAVVEGSSARVRIAYPDPGEEALLALPRRMRAGRITLTVREPGGEVERVRARPDEQRLGFVAPVAAGSEIVDVEGEDRCGNTVG